MDTDRNRARGVLYIDRNDRQPRELFGPRCRVVCSGPGISQDSL
jgi:hypothetical protein